jgi:hypothetical protein
VSHDDQPRADDLSDELAKKYDPERLLKMMAARAGRGDPLDASIRAKYEKRFGVDLGHVRVVTGAFAEEFNRQRDAYAVTVGGTGMILMGGSPDKAMHSAEGQALLAHEITHVAQAQRGLHRSGLYDDVMEFTQEHEEEAHEVEALVRAEAMGNTRASAALHEKRIKAEQQRKQDIDKIKQRVIDMFGEYARNHHARNGSSRR